MTTQEKRARLVQLMLEIARLDRDEYRKLRAEMWEAVARSSHQKEESALSEWNQRAS